MPAQEAALGPASCAYSSQARSQALPLGATEAAWQSKPYSRRKAIRSPPRMPQYGIRR